MFKLFCGLVVLALGADRAAAFALKGPFETYQVPALFYATGDLGGPHNWGEEYRRNTPVVYYTFGTDFRDYFGSNGVAAIDEAFALLNSVTNVSSYSSDLSEWPLEAQAFNFRASALNLTDLKSYFLSILLEEMGLAEAERFVWTLHDRAVGPGGCPANVTYLVEKRNFDPVFTQLDELQASSYVNGTLYSYHIIEFCSGTFLADAVEFAVDPSANTFTAISGYVHGVAPALGAYFTGLTRDDVGGLRYLLRTNNVNFEGAGTNTLTVFTNTAVSQLLFTSNLTLLVNQSLTNDAATLLALFPGLVISSETPIFTNVVTTNVFFYFTNFPWAPAGSGASVAFVTNRTTNVVTWFSRTFANVVTNSYYTKGFITVLTTNISNAACGPTAPAGSGPCTNVTQATFYTNFINGEYFILPTNSACGISIVNTQLVSVLTETNISVSATNAPGTTNVGNQQFSQTFLFYFTNTVYVIHPVPCITNLIERRQGIEHVQFIRYDGAYDDLQDIYLLPITNEYQLISVPLTNPIPVPRKVIRPIVRPDFIVTAMDLATEQNVAVRRGNLAITGFGQFDLLERSVPYNGPVLPGLYGPGTIEPDVEIRVSKTGPLFINFTPFNLDEINNVPFFAWGSFDGSTNAPVVYPNGTSTLNYENQIYIQVEPLYLPQGFLTTTPLHTSDYRADLSVASYTPSFVPPVSWSLAPGSYPLPPGLNLATTGSTNAVISGTPTAVGTFDFTLRLTDSQAHTFDRTYFIKINP